MQGWDYAKVLLPKIVGCVAPVTEGALLVRPVSKQKASHAKAMASNASLLIPTVSRGMTLTLSGADTCSACISTSLWTPPPQMSHSFEAEAFGFVWAEVTCWIPAVIE